MPVYCHAKAVASGVEWIWEREVEEEDLVPQTLRPKPLDLDSLSIEALNEYIDELEGEIERVRAAIAAKESWRGEAESFFKS